MKIILQAFAAVLALSLVASCSKSPQEKIAGKWKSNDGETIQFNEDGTMTISGDRRNDSYYNWHIPEEGKMILTAANGDDGTVAYKSPAEDIIVLTIGSKEITLTRINESSSITSSSSIVGVYGGPNCPFPFKDMELTENGKLYTTFAGLQTPYSYEVDGNRVVIYMDGEGLVVTRNGNSLVFYGGGAVCTKN